MGAASETIARKVGAARAMQMKAQETMQIVSGDKKPEVRVGRLLWDCELSLKPQPARPDLLCFGKTNARELISGPASRRELAF